MDINNLKRDLLNCADVIIEHKNEGDIEAAMYNFKKILVDLYIPEIVNSSDSKTLSTLYISQKVIDDFWGDFANDASFGIENIDKKDKEEFALGFAYFVKYGLEGKYNETMINLHKVINIYYQTILKVESKLATKVYIGKSFEINLLKKS